MRKTTTLKNTMQLLGFFTLIFQMTFAQHVNSIDTSILTDYTMSNGTIQACSGVFLDPGGNGNYSNGATTEMTIEPLVAGDGVCLNFTSFNLDYSSLGVNYSALISFYDGSSSSAPLIMTATDDWSVNASGTAFDFKGPGMVCANGPLTIVFNPDGSDMGWEADISCFTPLPDNSGCTITADGTAGATTATTLYIDAGDQVDLAALGNVVDVPLSNDFNGGTIGTGWNTTVTADFSNPSCVGSSADGTTFLWMGTNSSPRTLSSQTYDVSNGGTVSFDIKFATQYGGDPCEGPDLVDEGVYLQYSTDSGTTWNTLHYFFPSFYTDGSSHLQSWNNYVFNIPPAAQSTTTQFRWTQQEISSTTTDHWGLDNVVISIDNAATISWDQGLGLGNNHTVYPTVDTTYTATITDAFGNSCSTPVQVFINVPSTTIDFDGTNDYIDRASLLSGAGSVSMMSWIKIDASADGGDIMGQGNYRLYVDSAQRLKTEVSTYVPPSTVTYTVNMFDSYSDGWNTSGDGYLLVSVAGVAVAGSPFEPANGVSPDTATFTVNAGDVVDLAFRSDNYPGEMSFNIKNTTDGGVQAFPASGNQNHTGGGNSILNYSFTASCSSCSTANAQAITPDISAPLLASELWYHVATIYEGSTGTVKTYLNGELQWTGSGLGALLDSNADDFEIGRKADTQNNYFEGSIYESRVYDLALTEVQLREQIYQEIQNVGGKVHGSVIPKAIDNGSLDWLNLVAYYKMDTVASSDTADSSASGIVGNLNNMTTTQDRSAPLPYVANSSGPWTASGTWEYGSLWDVTAIENARDWAIIQVTNSATLTTTSDHNHLGLLVDAGATFRINNDSGVFNTNYLKIDGILDLEGESQLIQTSTSDLDTASAGVLSRDQQGKADIYSYNYWSSPVGPINTLTNNNDYTVGGVLNDGNNSVNFTTGYDGSPTAPVTISNYWIFTYDNQPDDYLNWTQVFDNGQVRAGQGYTMKGSGSGTTTNSQNYTFIGKPNNGTITHSVSPNNLSLLGNPYPSALDADQFILDNINVMNEDGDVINAGISTGALYFWEHFTTNSSHILSQYEGGYATYNLAGATMAIPDPDVSANGTGSVLPQQYIPVGQGFFVQGGEGGTITFNNGQRAFQKESSGNSIFSFTGQETPSDALINSTVSAPKPGLGRLYFRMNIPNGPQRQLLLAVKEGKSLGIDYGYDAKMIETNPTDAAWDIQSTPYVIQTIGAIASDTEIPLIITAETSGFSEFSIEELQGIPSDLPIYFVDKQTGAYTDLRSDVAVFEIIENQEYRNRYFVVFAAPVLSNDDVINVEDDLIVYHTAGQIIIKNKAMFSAGKIKVFNTLGQLAISIDTTFTQVDKVVFPAQVSSGTYIVQFEYNEHSTISRKLLIE